MVPNLDDASHIYGVTVWKDAIMTANSHHASESIERITASTTIYFFV